MVKRSLALIIGTAGGVGCLPRGAATAGTLLGAATFARVRPPFKARLALAAIAAGAGQIASSILVTDDDHDPSYIVVDEVAGVWFALAPVPITPVRAAAGATIFRLLDKTKPGIVGLVEARGGRYSVMGDDLAAGLITAMILIAGASVASSSG